MLKMLRKADPDINIDTAMAAFVPDDDPPVQIAEYYAAKLTDLLNVERRNERVLVDQLTDITEQLRQTRLVIASIEPAQVAIAGDIHD
jgi:hypothetical protein